MEESLALHHIPLFASLDDGETARLLAVMQHACYHAGETILREGEPGDCLYVVSEGAVKILTDDHEGGQVVLAEAGAGAFFGELSLLTGGARSATVVATQDTVALTLSRDDFLRFLDETPHASRTIITVLAERVQSTSMLVRSGMRSANEIADEQATIGQIIADGFARIMGSWSFIGIQSAALISYVVWNVAWPGFRWDPYPFLLMSLLLSFQAAYAAPIIMMSQNRQSNKDRLTIASNHEVNVKMSVEIGKIVDRLDHLENLLRSNAKRA